LGGGDHEDLPAGECSRPSQSEIHRVALAIHVTGIGVHFIEEQVAGRHRARPDRAVGSGHHQDSTGKFLGEHRVSGVARTGIAHQFPQHGTFLDQRIDALL
jgi:hypothetical protein